MPPEARKLYDPRGDQTLCELKHYVLADKTLVEPARHHANEAARAGQPISLHGRAGRRSSESVRAPPHRPS
jgi:hypothetical protein